MNNQQPVEHFFRHHYGKLVALLCKKVGLNHIDDVEDAVQSALMTALEKWTQKAMPKNPSAWLYKVACNHVIDTLRQKNRRAAILIEKSEESTITSHSHLETLLLKEFEDETLNWLFICCNPAIAIESQLVFALKTLCGFNIKEISLRLFITEANAYKRFTRARNHLKQNPSLINELNASNYTHRLSAVNKILYLIFTEGYLSSHLKKPIRKELCEDAIRLTSLLAHHKTIKDAKIYALLALMHLQIARINARQDDAGNLLLLVDQDRSLWDKHHINTGLFWLAKSAQGNHFSRYHAEASIAVEHCLAPSFEQTRWHKIVESYNLLAQSSPSALHQLNHAIALAEWKGPEAGLALLDDFSPPKWLMESYQWHAVIADLNQRCHHQALWQKHADKALSLAPNLAVKNTLKKRLKIH